MSNSIEELRNSTPNLHFQPHGQIRLVTEASNQALRLNFYVKSGLLPTFRVRLMIYDYDVYFGQQFYRNYNDDIRFFTGRSEADEFLPYQVVPNMALRASRTPEEGILFTANLRLKKKNPDRPIEKPNIHSGDWYVMDAISADPAIEAAHPDFGIRIQMQGRRRREMRNGNTEWTDWWEENDPADQDIPISQSVDIGYLVPHITGSRWINGLTTKRFLFRFTSLDDNANSIHEGSMLASNVSQMHITYSRHTNDTLAAVEDRSFKITYSNASAQPSQNLPIEQTNDLTGFYEQFPRPEESMPLTPEWVVSNSSPGIIAINQIGQMRVGWYYPSSVVNNRNEHLEFRLHDQRFIFGIASEGRNGSHNVFWTERAVTHDLQGTPHSSEFIDPSVFADYYLGNVLRSQTDNAVTLPPVDFQVQTGEMGYLEQDDEFIVWLRLNRADGSQRIGYFRRVRQTARLSFKALDYLDDLYEQTGDENLRQSKNTILRTDVEPLPMGEFRHIAATFAPDHHFGVGNDRMSLEEHIRGFYDEANLNFVNAETRHAAPISNEIEALFSLYPASLHDKVRSFIRQAMETHQNEVTVQLHPSFLDYIQPPSDEPTTVTKSVRDWLRLMVGEKVEHLKIGSSSTTIQLYNGLRDHALWRGFFTSGITPAVRINAVNQNYYYEMNFFSYGHGGKVIVSLAGGIFTVRISKRRGPTAPAEWTQDFRGVFGSVGAGVQAGVFTGKMKDGASGSPISCTFETMLDLEAADFFKSRFHISAVAGPGLSFLSASFVSASSAYIELVLTNGITLHTVSEKWWSFSVKIPSFEDLKKVYQHVGEGLKKFSVEVNARLFSVTYTGGEIDAEESLARYGRRQPSEQDPIPDARARTQLEDSSINVFFRKDSAVINPFCVPSALINLACARRLLEMPCSIDCGGFSSPEFHRSPSNSEEAKTYNLNLSRDRAEAVLSKLIRPAINAIVNEDHNYAFYGWGAEQSLKPLSENGGGLTDPTTADAQTLETERPLYAAWRRVDVYINAILSACLKAD